MGRLSQDCVVLVVEDDEDIRGTTVALLQAYGFQVHAASTGDEALEVLNRRQDVDLLLTDIRMPGHTNGWQLAHKAKQQRPHIRVIYMSGYTDIIPKDCPAVGYGPLLPKPWRAEQLRSHVEKVLQLRRTGTRSGYKAPDDGRSSTR
jgi:CheY-like chemotaxis protein